MMGLMKVASLFALVVAAPAEAIVVIESDRVIDEDLGSIRVVEGPEGPPKVKIVAGGHVVGMHAFGASTVELDGGLITFPPHFFDTATFVMRSGQVSCSEFVCDIINFDADLTAESTSVLELRGGRIGDGSSPGVVRLLNQSVLKVYGTELDVTPLIDGDRFITGRFVTGEPIDLRTRLSIGSGSVHLITVPEPAAGVTGLLVAVIAFHQRRRRGTRQAA